MNIEHDGFGQYAGASEVATGSRMSFRAEQVREERTGMHAKVTVLLDDAMLTYSTFNVDRDEDRVRLANSAYKHVERDAPLVKAYPKEYFKADLDRFCHGLREALLDSVAVEDLQGDEDRTPPPFLLYPYMLQGGGTILYGPPGRGKSFALLLMAVSLDAGLRTVFDVPKPRRCLVVNLERSGPSMRKRLGDVNETLGLPRGRRMKFLNARGKSLTDVAERVRKAVRDEGIEVLCLDSLSRAGAGDLTENAPVNKITDLLNGLAPSWFALGHSPRGDDTHVFGSMMFDAAADVMVQLVSQVAREKWEVGIGLEVTKANDFLPPEMQVLALQFSEEGLGLVGVRQASRREFGTLNTRQERSMPDAVFTYVTEHGEASPSAVADATGFNRSNVSTFLANDGRFVARKNGREMLYRIVLSEPNGQHVGQHNGQHMGNTNGMEQRVVLPALSIQTGQHNTFLGEESTPPHPPGATDGPRSDVLPLSAYGRGNTSSPAVDERPWWNDDDDDHGVF